MIVITGATGTIGSEVVRLLAARGVPVRAVTRDPERARMPAGVEVVRGDYTDTASMAAAFAGAEAAFLVGLLGPEFIELDQALVAAALAAALGRPLEVFDVPEDLAREHMLAAGMSAEFADGSLAGQAYVRAGRNAVVTGDVRQVLGRPARTYADWVRDHLALFAQQS
ncbi:NmrA family NAD(P)-binding protein [Nocardia sp. 2]|uniref:NmrA family NAD(P)-binding protein n=1 Tax=Nocardia acididurans TaxID=2802282 RepID=A0ABS1MHL6_9NOCA|nr:NmrA family NAD(P)-binding protein [Nocardia acididurans]MBL1080158.1 NmrA family NAD(P)-binding protein [Nocardia acididurans]